MHHFQGPHGTAFNFNSDMSGDVSIYPAAHATPEPVEIPAEDILAFVAEIQRREAAARADDEAPEKPTPREFLAEYEHLCRKYLMFIWNYRTEGVTVAVLRSEGENRGFTRDHLECHLTALREPE